MLFATCEYFGAVLENKDNTDQLPEEKSMRGAMDGGSGLRMILFKSNDESGINQTFLIPHS